jgi:hypothetical protein
MTSWGVVEMYRDDPLDDEAELREIVGDAQVDALLDAGGVDALLGALDALRILQGWVDEAACSAWLSDPQRRLGGRSPLVALASGDDHEVAEVLRAFVAAQT